MIQVVKIGLTRDMIIPEDISRQPEIPRIEIPDFYANKRLIGDDKLYKIFRKRYKKYAVTRKNKKIKKNKKHMENR